MRNEWLIYLQGNYSEQRVCLRNIYRSVEITKAAHIKRYEKSKPRLERTKRKYVNALQRPSYSFTMSQRFLGDTGIQMKPENRSTQAITCYSQRRRSRRKFEFTVAGAPRRWVRGENAVLLTPPACSDLFPLDISRRK